MWADMEGNQGGWDSRTLESPQQLDPVASLFDSES